jgi:hypothetical protein
MRTVYILDGTIYMAVVEARPELKQGTRWWV